ncbi:MAG TPA: hypothetical protein VMV69_08795 [Pirellulales bacterium]|nr:hypothetical protein [Pirellulales bacterium]
MSDRTSPRNDRSREARAQQRQDTREQQAENKSTGRPDERSGK